MRIENNKKTLLKYFNLFCLTFILIIGFVYGDNVSGSNQKDFVNLLITISAIVFGVMGAWLSLMKIELQVGIESANSIDEANDHMKRGRGLIYPITISALVLIGSIIFSFSYYVIPSLSLNQNIISILKQVSFAVICFGAYNVVYTLIIVIFQGGIFLINLSDQNQSTRIRIQRKR